MSKGDGSIYQAKDKEGKPIKNCWRVSVTLDSGRRMQCTVHGSKADARKRRDEIRRQSEDGLEVDAEKTTVGDFIDVWLEARRTSGKVSDSTLSNYHSVLKAVRPYLANRPITKVTPAEIDRMYSMLRKEGKSGATLLKLHTVLKSVFEKALDYDMIRRNPCKKVETPSAGKPDRKPLTRDEAVALMAYLEAEEERLLSEMDAKEERQVSRGNQYGRESIRGLASLGFVIGTRIALTTGLRRGEILGLTWGCVDLVRNEITVARSLDRNGVPKEPKTESGKRTVSIDSTTAWHLREWRIRQFQELAKLSIRPDGMTPVCCSEIGGWAGPANFERWWRSFRVPAGFPNLRFHELRHTQATHLVANGIDLKTVQARMGHANIGITLNFYAHAVKENDRKAAQLVGDLFNAPAPAEVRRFA